MIDNTVLAKHIHDARGPLNNISMQAELAKLVLQNGMPTEKAIAALDKIVLACQQCSEHLQQISAASKP